MPDYPVFSAGISDIRHYPVSRSIRYPVDLLSSACLQAKVKVTFESLMEWKRKRRPAKRWREDISEWSGGASMEEIGKKKNNSVAGRRHCDAVYDSGECA